MEKQKFQSSQFKILWEIVLLLILAFPLILPLLKSGMFISDDGNWMVVRLSDFHKSLRDGQFPVRWAGRLNHEFGYPVFNFLYPGVLYLGEVIHLLGFNFITSIKILFGLSMLASLFFSYLWLKTKFGRFPALVGSIIYGYAPYHLFDLYKRGSLGEIVALAAVPLIFWAIEKRRSTILSLCIALLITVHNTVAFLFLPVAFLYSMIRGERKVKSLISFVLGVLLASFFWLPALYDRQFTKFDSIEISNWTEFFLNPQNFYLLGWGSVLIFILSVFMVVKKMSTKVIFFLCLFFMSVFFASSYSNFLWNNTFLPKLIQFPWRLLSLTIIASAFLGAYLIESIPGKLKILTGLILAGIFIYSSQLSLKNIQYEIKEEGYYSTNEDTTTVKNEYMPKWVKILPIDRPEKKAEIISGKGELTAFFQNSSKIILKGGTITPAVVKVNIVYFPGWQAKVNGAITPISYENPQGVITFSVPSGGHEIEIEWKETPIRLIADLISITTLLVLVVLRKKPFRHLTI